MKKILEKILKKNRENTLYVLKKIAAVKKSTMLLYVFLSLLISVLPVLVSVIQKEIIDYLVDCIQVNDKLPHEFPGYCIYMGLTLFVLAVCRLAVDYINNTGGLKYRYRNMLRNVDKMSSLKMEHFENPKIHFLFDLSCAEPNVNPMVIVMHAMKILTVVITAVSYYLILLYLNIFVALLPAVVAIPLVIIGNKRELYEYQSKYDNEIMDLNRRITYFSSIVKEPLYAKDNAIYNVGKYFLKKRKQYKEALIDKKAGYIRRAVGISICVAFITLVTQYGIYFFLGVNVLHNNISIGSLSLYFNAFTTILLALNQIVDSSSYINAQVKLESALTEFMQLPEIDMKEEGNSLSREHKHRITFENVTFAYPGTDRKIIDNLSFTIDFDDTVALVGENGSGKSTVIKLMVGQYEPQSGRITIDGTDVAKYTPAELSAIYGVMFQNVEHVAVSIREFVSLSEEASDMKRFYDAIEKAECKKILDDSVAHEETIMGLGLNFEKTREFSGGEWQRLALARLFYADPDVFVMDEPTAALDAKTEYQFFERLKQLGKQHQIIMVSHRLSIAKLSTKIIFFSDEGIFVDTHNSLMNKVPSYKDLYKMQKNLYFGA